MKEAVNYIGKASVVQTWYGIINLLKALTFGHGKEALVPAQV